MSNVLAGIGRGQLEVLDLRVQQRRAIAFRYRDAFADLPGISLMPQAPYGLHTNWLSCFLIEGKQFGCSRDDLIRVLDARHVESRRVWKPMHLQPLYAGCARYGGEVAEDLFRRGISPVRAASRSKTSSTSSTKSGPRLALDRSRNSRKNPSLPTEEFHHHATI